ncbi:hypothetical protein D9M69_687970 [compost metagenome]
MTFKTPAVTRFCVVELSQHYRAFRERGTTVDNNRLPRYVGGFIRGQEQHGIGNFLWLSQFANWNKRCHFLQLVLICQNRHRLRLDITRLHAIDGNILPG